MKALVKDARRMHKQTGITKYGGGGASVASVFPRWEEGKATKKTLKDELFHKKKKKHHVRIITC
jgi:hypothetical protein